MPHDDGTFGRGSGTDAGHDCHPCGVKDIETRTLIAYALIILLIAAAIGGVAFLRYNSHARKIDRQREREIARREDRKLDP